jgi:O-antigen/teichoic acid export membrane protein
MGGLKSLVKRSNNIHSLIGNLVFAAFSMLLFLMMVRLLSIDMYGRWIIFITTVSLLDMLRIGLTGTGAIHAISTSNGDDKNKNISASYRLNIYTTLIISVIFIPIYFIFAPFVGDSYYFPVLLYYPLLALANLAHMQATNYSQGIINFKRVMIIRSLLGSLNFLFIGLYIWFFDETLNGIIITYSLSDILVSTIVVILKWDGRQYLKIKCKQNILDLLQFGKYSTASSIGSNLLRSSDTIIISLSTIMGAQAVAIYAIPLKFVEMIEIPLRSFNATSLPKLSAAFKTSKDEFRKVLNMYVSYSVLMLIPVIIIIPLFSTMILKFFGGSNYADSLELQKQILYIISFYIIALPYDRYSGIALFAFNKPKLNFYKVFIMLFINIIFDLIAVFVFHSLPMIAIGSVAFTFAGIAIGWYYIYKFSDLRMSESIQSIWVTTKYVSNQIVKFSRSRF